MRLQWVDNPHEAKWLEYNQRTPTASYHAEVDPRIIAKLPGKNGEHWRINTNSYSQTVIGLYAESMRTDQWDWDRSGRIFIGVEYDGKAYIFEGNHRTRAAIAAGITIIPIEIRYFGGSEELPERWNPSHVERKGVI